MCIGKEQYTYEVYNKVHIPFNINSGGTMSENVTGGRENRKGNGRTVPCKIKLKWPKIFLSKAEYIIRDIVSRRQNNL